MTPEEWAKATARSDAIHAAVRALDDALAEAGHESVYAILHVRDTVGRDSTVAARRLSVETVIALTPP